MDGPKNKSQNNEFPSKIVFRMAFLKKYGGAVTLLIGVPKWCMKYQLIEINPNLNLNTLKMAGPQTRVLG